jgi:hypothetical protein
MQVGLLDEHAWCRQLPFCRCMKDAELSVVVNAVYEHHA